MKHIAVCFAVLALGAAAIGAEPAKPRLLEKANVLPLALDDAFEFRKTKTFLHDPETEKPTFNQVLQFERRRVEFGAVSAVERRQRYGHYFTFFWRAKREAALTIRLEYRQEKLGSFVQARELLYEDAKGSQSTEFKVIGDDYEEDGRITAWRALLIENGRVVALNQSFNWN